MARSALSVAVKKPSRAGRSATPKAGFYAAAARENESEECAKTTGASSLPGRNHLQQRGQAARDPNGIKHAVNSWLACLARAVFDGQNAEQNAVVFPKCLRQSGEEEESRENGENLRLRCLLLESSQLLTVRELQRARVARSCGCGIWIPNPSASECAKMRAEECLRCAQVEETVTHVLLRRLSRQEDGGSPGGETAAAVGAADANDSLDNGPSPVIDAAPFDFVWLDYCGTFGSRAGRQRQDDILRLLDRSSGLLARRALLAVTFSVRGSAPLYEHELVDSVVLFVQAVAQRQARCAKCVGVVAYSISGPMYTVAFVIEDEDQGNDADSDGDTLERPHRGIGVLPSMDTDAAVGATFFAEWLPRGADFVHRVSTPLWDVYLYLSRCFASLVLANTLGRENSSGGVVDCLVLDSKLLPVSSELARKIGARLRCRSVISDPLDGMIAHEVRDHIPAPGSGGGGCAKNEVSVHVCEPSEAFLELERPALGYRAVWLGYDRKRAFSAAELQRCDRWPDLNSVFEGKLLSQRYSSTVAVSINHSSVGGCWEGSWADWLITGVSRCADTYGFDASPLLVTSFVASCPRLTVIFAVNAMSAAAELDGPAWSDSRESEVLEIPHPVISGFVSTNAWDLQRRKVPDCGSSKLSRLSPFISGLLEHFGCRNVCLHEHGFLVVLPALLDMEPRIAVTCVTDDAIQRTEVTRLARCKTVSSAAVASAEEECAAAADSLLLLCESGVKDVLSRWVPFVRQWLDTAQTPKVLTVLVEASSQHDVDALATAVEQQDRQDVLQRDTTLSLRCTSRRWVLLSFVPARAPGRESSQMDAWLSSPLRREGPLK